MPSLNQFKQSFPTVVGRLHQARLNGRVGQAYLFIGDDIAFLEKFAMAWAQTAACLSPHEDGEACGHCPRCQDIERGIYPELTIVRPSSKSRQITVDSMAEFEHAISLSARPDHLKIGMLVEAERLNASSQNAFLKTLEEPPPHTMLMLLTTNVRMLLPTTRSRCQTISLLRNRQDYTELAQTGLFQHLALLHRQAGANSGIRAAAGIGAILDTLHAKAKGMVDDTAEKQWAAIDNATMRKQAEDELKAKVEGEYIRLRAQVLDAIQTWFLQRLLFACGTPLADLPNPEMFEGLRVPRPVPEEAAQDIHTAEDFMQSIIGNVDEKLSLDSFCLTISRKRN